MTTKKELKRQEKYREEEVARAICQIPWWVIEKHLKRREKLMTTNALFKT